MGENRNLFRFLVGKLKLEIPHEDIGLDGRIILKWIL
jgi:hypothetical protein